VYEPPRFMTIKQCIEQLLEVEEKRKEGGNGPRPHHRYYQRSSTLTIVCSLWSRDGVRGPGASGSR
jgi:diphthamide biosynthesis methyltransferase